MEAGLRIHSDNSGTRPRARRLQACGRLHGAARPACPPADRLPAQPQRPVRGGRPADAKHGFARVDLPGDGHARDVGVVVQRQRRLCACAQPARSPPMRSEPSPPMLPDSSAPSPCTASWRTKSASVSSTARKRASRPSATAARGRHGRQARGRQRRQSEQAQQLRPARARLDRRGLEQRLQRPARAPAEIAAEHGVPDFGHDHQAASPGSARRLRARSRSACAGRRRR